MSFKKFSIATLVLLAVAVSAYGQGRKPIPREVESQYLVSVKAGIVNFIEGSVDFKRGETWNAVIDGEELQSGDLIRTGANGRVEVLLNPGSYLRLAENSGFVFTDTSVDDIKLHLSYGSVIIEASAVNNLISITTAQAEYSIPFGGLYRFNVSPDAKDEVIVRKGAVVVGASTVTIGGAKVPLTGTVIREGERMQVGTAGPSGKPQVARLGKPRDDSMDKWSKDRAKTIVATNQKLRVNGLSGRVASMLGAGMGLGGGFRVFDMFCGCYTFVPSGFYDPWVSSPYGYFYTHYCWFRSLAPGDTIRGGVRYCCDYGGGGGYSPRSRSPIMGGPAGGSSSPRGTDTSVRVDRGGGPIGPATPVSGTGGGVSTAPSSGSSHGGGDAAPSTPRGGSRPPR